MNTERMDVNLIREALIKLPAIRRGATPEDHQKFIGVLKKAGFQVTKEYGFRCSINPTVIMLAAWGPAEDRSEIAEGFIKILGLPDGKFQLSFQSNTDFLWWYLSRIQNT